MDTPERKGLGNRARWAGILLVAVLAGCATVDFDRPQASLADISIVEGGLIEQRYRVKLRFMNPTDQALEVEGLVYELEVNGRTFARGVSDRAFTVPRLSEQTVEVTATGNLGGIVRQAMDVASGNRTRVDYRIVGRLVTKNSGRVPFDTRGDIPLPADLLR